MTLRHLQIFRTVCNLESITAAGEQLNMTQPAVSLAIKELESFYRVRLFERMNRRIYITEAGRTLLQYAETVLAQFDESVQVVRASGAGGCCRFGVNVTIGETRLAAWMAAIGAALPGTRLNVFVNSTRSIEKKLADHQLDFAVVDDLPLAQHWQADLLDTEEMLPVCSPDFLLPDPLTLSALAQLPLLLREQGSGSRDSVNAVFQRAGCAAVPAVESSSSLCLLTMAEQGLGVAFLPLTLAAPSLQRGTLRPLAPENAGFFRHYYLIRHPKKYLAPPMQAVIQTIRSCCAPGGSTPDPGEPPTKRA